MIICKKPKIIQECRGILAARCASCNCMTRTSAILPKAISAGGFTPSWYTECALWSVFPIQISPFSNNLYFRLTLLYHGLRHRTSVLFIFSQFISHLQRKENSCYIMLNQTAWKEIKFFFLQKIQHTAQRRVMPAAHQTKH